MIEKLVKEISRYSRLYNFTISTAESCTGGFISHLLTNIKGSSDYFMGGLVTYSKEFKINILNIDPEILDNFGIYSIETAEAMAQSIKNKFGTTVGISTTGIAPPGDSRSSETVGKVCIGLVIKNHTLSKEIYIDSKDRQNFKEKTTEDALVFLIEEIARMNT